MGPALGSAVFQRNRDIFSREAVWAFIFGDEGKEGVLFVDKVFPELLSLGLFILSF